MFSYDFPDPMRVLQNLALKPGQSVFRLMRIYYPVQAVTVEVQERLAEDFEEIELLLETLIAEEIADLTQLAELVGVDEEGVAKFVRLAVGYGHIQVDAQGRLSITALGRESLRRGQKLTRFTRPQTLLCDGISGEPLRREYYAIPRADLAREPESKTQVITPRLEVARSALESAAASPDRARRNLVDEVEAIGAVQEAEIQYFRAMLAVVSPVAATGRATTMTFRVFVSPQLTLNAVDPATIAPLLSQPGFDLSDIARWLQTKHIPCGIEDLAFLPDGNLSVRLPAGTGPSPLVSELLLYVAATPDSAVPCDLTLDFRGQGRLAYLWTQDPALLRRAAVAQVLNALEGLQQQGLDGENVRMTCAAVSERLGVMVAGTDLLGALSDGKKPFLLERLEQALA